MQIGWFASCASVEFESLSWAHNGGAPGKAPRQARHELDVCVLEPGVGERPSHSQIFAGISCKDVRRSSKENVREALRLRRETAFLQRPLQSLAPWLVTEVPTRPSSPILLISSDVGVRKAEFRYHSDAFQNAAKSRLLTPGVQQALPDL
jgi:hypothetical protein